MILDQQVSATNLDAMLEDLEPCLTDVDSALVDLEPSLTDLLTFIDSNFDPPERISTTPERSSNADPSVRVSQTPAQAQHTDIIPSKGVKARSAQASRLYRMKKRAELNGLRAQVATLENQLETLASGRARFPRLERRARAWIDASQLMDEKTRRQEAEARNRKLRAAVAEHLRVATAIQHALRHAAVFVDLHVVAPVRPAASLSGFQTYTAAAKDGTMYEMAAGLAQLHAAAVATFSRTHAADWDGSTSKQRQKRDLASGLPYVEVEHLATLPIAISRAVHVLQDMLATSSQPLEPGNLQGAHYMRFVGGFRDKSRSMTLDILRVSRGYEEAGRYIFTAISALFGRPGTSTLSFQDRSWIVVARSPRNPQTECVIQTLFQVSPAGTASSSSATSSAPAPSDGDKVTDLVLQQSGSVYRSAIRAIQDVMTLGEGNVVCSEYPTAPTSSRIECVAA